MARLTSRDRRPTRRALPNTHRHRACGAIRSGGHPAPRWPSRGGPVASSLTDRPNESRARTERRCGWRAAAETTHRGQHAWRAARGWDAPTSPREPERSRTQTCSSTLRSTDRASVPARAHPRRPPASRLPLSARTRSAPDSGGEDSREATRPHPSVRHSRSRPIDHRCHTAHTRPPACSHEGWGMSASPTATASAAGVAGNVCRPVTSAVNANSPFPTVSGEDRSPACRTGLCRLTSACRSKRAAGVPCRCCMACTPQVAVPAARTTKRNRGKVPFTLHSFRDWRRARGILIGATLLVLGCASVLASLLRLRQGARMLSHSG